ncbi:MAG: type II toxin-antitoxin system RelB/DinJ family antitoxin [Candidatus Nomurabacteria bacterium]|nr:type II toxin-antitoxin system RelB/DinJ family antitoxin [Candidatus Nomurabacteria bacterium]
MNTTINIRIEKKTKDKAQKTLESMGLDLSSGIKLFLNQVVNENGIPFKPTKNPAAIRAEWDREVEDALKNGKRYNSAREMHEDIIGKDFYK